MFWQKMSPNGADSCGAWWQPSCMTRMQSRHSRLNLNSRRFSFLVALVLAHTSVARAGSGEVDDSFQPVLDESVFANIVLTNGRYLVGGSFRNAGGEGGPEYLARFNADGSLDTTRASNIPDNDSLISAGHGHVGTIVAQPGGRVWL